jgi:mannitol/fructose-specific phosphotransferase system IIA component (Ntr-type)
VFQPIFSLANVTKANHIERERMERQVLANRIQANCKILTVHFNQEESYEENLSILLKKLEQMGLIDRHFSTQLLAKESVKFSFSLGGCAFPHLINHVEKKIVLVVLEKSEMQLKSVTGNLVNDFILICVPEKLDENEQDVLIKIFDNVFRIQEDTTVYKRLGIEYIKEREHVLCHH